MCQRCLLRPTHRTHRGLQLNLPQQPSAFSHASKLGLINSNNPMATTQRVAPQRDRRELWGQKQPECIVFQLRDRVLGRHPRPAPRPLRLRKRRFHATSVAGILSQMRHIAPRPRERASCLGSASPSTRRRPSLEDRCVPFHAPLAKPRGRCVDYTRSASQGRPSTPEPWACLCRGCGARRARSIAG